MTGPSGLISVAQCPAGEVVLGGGFFGPIGDVVNVSMPIDQGWQAEGELPLQAYAICSVPTP
ncbi:hypothetical protein ACFVQ4_13655 [Streptomyces laurentii]|uniref:hypothetical protein n=1 Tax=Streptomyces laurentii TaxID=39478 RepID=UPI0036BE1C02